MSNLIFGPCKVGKTPTLNHSGTQIGSVLYKSPPPIPETMSSIGVVVDLCCKKTTKNIARFTSEAAAKNNAELRTSVFDGVSPTLSVNGKELMLDMNGENYLQSPLYKDCNGQPAITADRASIKLADDGEFF